MSDITTQDLIKTLKNQIKHKDIKIQNLADINYAQHVAYKKELEKYKNIVAILVTTLLITSSFCIYHFLC